MHNCISSQLGFKLQRSVCAEGIAARSVVKVNILFYLRHPSYLIWSGGGHHRVGCHIMLRGGREHGSLLWLKVSARGAGNTWHTFGQSDGEKWPGRQKTETKTMPKTKAKRIWHSCFCICLYEENLAHCAASPEWWPRPFRISPKKIGFPENICSPGVK